MVGEKEKTSSTVNVRTRDNKVHGERSVEECIERLKQLKACRSRNAEEDFWDFPSSFFPTKASADLKIQPGWDHLLMRGINVSKCCHVFAFIIFFQKSLSNCFTICFSFNVFGCHLKWELKYIQWSINVCYCNRTKVFKPLYWTTHKLRHRPFLKTFSKSNKLIKTEKKNRLNIFCQSLMSSGNCTWNTILLIKRSILYFVQLFVRNKIRCVGVESRCHPRDSRGAIKTNCSLSWSQKDHKYEKHGTKTWLSIGTE